MKNLKNIIQEKLRISKDSEFNLDYEDFFNKIDVSKYKWDNSSRPTFWDEYEKWQEDTKKFAKSLSLSLEELFKLTCSKWMSTDPALRRKKNWIKEQLKYIEKYGWEEYKKSYLGMGWWCFISWISKQIK